MEYYDKTRPFGQSIGLYTFLPRLDYEIVFQRAQVKISPRIRISALMFGIWHLPGEQSDSLWRKRKGL